LLFQELREDLILKMKIFAIGDFHGKFPDKLRRKIKEEKPDLILGTGDYTGIDDWRPLLKKVFKARRKGVELNVEKLIGEEEYKKLLEKDYKAGEVVLKKINKLKIKTFSVFGNGDWYKVFFNDAGKYYEKLIKKLRYIKNINRGRGSFGKIRIVGFGGYLDPDIYFTKRGMKAIGENEKSNKKRRKRYNKEEKNLMRLMKSKPDIMLAHYTPYNCLDKMKARGHALTGSHMGVSYYNRAIKRFSPVLVICGHMHEYQGVKKIGRTKVVAVGSAYEGKAAIIEMDERNHKIENIRFIK